MQTLTIAGARGTTLTGALAAEAASIARGAADAIEELLADPRRPARAVLDAATATFAGHVELLERALGQRAAVDSCGYEAVRRLFGPPCSTAPHTAALRDAYTAANLAAMQYTALHAAALAAGERGLARLALDLLTETTPLVARISRELPVVAVLEAEGATAGSQAAARQALADTQAAWTHLNRRRAA